MNPPFVPNPDHWDRLRHSGTGRLGVAGPVSRRGRGQGQGQPRNDVRVNLLALALTRLFRESLGGVLRREVMDPIGASDTWEWHGYANSIVEIDGRPVESVSGGAHWGGGLWMSALRPRAARSAVCSVVADGATAGCSASGGSTTA